jgi:MerR family transcriptional regulator, light-induced transcriptional regulator
MGRYSIKDLERLSGIKAHTLRIWELRYEIIKPKRTNTNIRFYSDEDLKKILNISLLNKYGVKISAIAEMSDNEISRRISGLNDTESDVNNQINMLTSAMVELDENSFEKIIADNIIKYGLENTMIKVVYPFLNRIGTMWQTGAVNPAQEHFMSNLIRQKLIVAIDAQRMHTDKKSPSFLLFCPEGELHEIPLLFAQYIIKSKMFRVFYLGASVPLNDLLNVARIINPDFLFSSLTTRSNLFQTHDYILKLSKIFNNQKIILTGNEFISDNNSYPKNINRFRTVGEITEFLNRLK